MANSTMLVQVNSELLVERVRPRRAKNPKRATNPRVFKRRTHHSDSRRLGMARTRGASDQDSCSPVLRITSRTTTSTARNRYTSTTERLAESTLLRMSASATPTATPPASVPGSERMRASNDTTSTRSSSGSAMAAVPAWAELMPCKGARKMAVAAANAPEMVHTIVEVRRGEVPYTRAVSALEAEARTASPKRVREMNQARAAISTGITASTTSSRAWRRRWSVGVHVALNGAGIGPGATTLGRLNLAKSTIWPTPMVAISTTRRGDAKSRLITISSMAMPTAAQAARASTNDSHQFKPYWASSSTNRATPNAPTSPWAKLSTPVER